MQEAVGIGLENAEKHDFFPKQLEAYSERRDIITSYFDKLGMSYTKPEGSYFLLVDMSRIKVPDSFEVPATCKGRGKDFKLCWWLAQEIRVVGIPPSEVSDGTRAKSHALSLYSSTARSMGMLESVSRGSPLSVNSILLFVRR